MKITLKIKDIFSGTQTVTLDKKVTLAYGLNGTGKTTLSTFLYEEHADKSVRRRRISRSYYFSRTTEVRRESIYSKCKTEGFGDKRVLVFSQRFIEDNFYDVDVQRGIFNLSAEGKEIAKEKARLEGDLTKEHRRLRGQQRRLEMLREGLEDYVWDLVMRQNDGEGFYPSLEVERGDAMPYPHQRRVARISMDRKRKKSLLKVFEDTPMPDSAPNHSVDSLHQEANDLRAARREVSETAMFDFSAINKIEADPIWGESIQGRDDSPYAAFISDMKNVDWVKLGMKYVSQKKQRCPLCQQGMGRDIAKGLKDYFDTQYEKKVQKINDLTAKYVRAIDEFARDFYRGQEFIAYGSIAFGDEARNVHVLSRRIFRIIEANRNGMRDKAKFPGMKVSMTSSGKEQKEYRAALNALNSSIAEFNAKVKDKAKATSASGEKFRVLMKWKYGQGEFFQNSKKEIEDVEAEMNLALAEVRKLENAIAEQEKALEDVQKRQQGIRNSARNINKGLLDLGITNFKLAVAGDYYVIKRENRDRERGVFKSLSEGEKTIICFLYFMERCAGKGSASEARRDKQVIVIDDPISSLSHQHMFNVSQMIYRDLVKDKASINTVLVLTHNLYFFHELKRIIGDPHCESIAMYRFSKKPNKAQVSLSRIVKMGAKEIMNEYQSYWQILRENKSNRVLDVMVANTMRNIVEYYFGLVLNKNSLSDVLKKVLRKGNKKDQAFARYMNRESHSDMENLTFDSKESEMWRDYFEKVFDKNGHIKHYKAMMRPQRAVAKTKKASARRKPSPPAKPRRGSE